MARELKLNRLSAHGNWVPAGSVRTRTADSASSRRRGAGNLLVAIWRENWFQVNVSVSLETTRFRGSTQWP
jgi:hypothetical protein